MRESRPLRSDFPSLTQSRMNNFQQKRALSSNAWSSITPQVREIVSYLKDLGHSAF